MPRATVILREKVIDEEGNIVELTIWRVPVTSPSAARDVTGTRQMVSSTILPSSSITFSRRITVARGISPQYMVYEAIYQRLDPPERRRPNQGTVLRAGLERGV